MTPKPIKEAEVLYRPKPGELTARNDPPFVDGDFQKQFPLLYEMLTATSYDDNAPRTTSTLLVFCENGVLRLCLNDRDNSRSAFFTAETFVDGLQVIDQALTSGRVDWRMKNRMHTPF